MIRKKPSYEIIMTIILLIPLFKPSGLEYYPAINNLFLIWKFFSLFIIAFNLISDVIRSKQVIINKGILAFLVFWVIYIANNFSKNISDTEITNNAVISILLVSYFINRARHGKLLNLLKSLNCIFKCWFWLQIISVVLSRSGIALFGRLDGDYLYFLGTDNYSSFMMIPMIGIIMYADCLVNDNKYKPSLFYISLYTLVNLWVKSYTAFIGGTIIILLIVLSRNVDNIIKWLSIKKMIIICVIFLVAVLFFKVQNSFSWLLVDIMHKGLSLSSRTFIWGDALNIIKENLFFGRGSFTNAEISSYILYGTTHAHNIILELLMRTGVIGTLAYLIFMLYPLKPRRHVILLIFYIGQFVLFFMDFYVSIQYFYCFVGLLYAEKIAKINVKGVS
ncbi:MAG: O-antigen ligase family protein [Holdemanella porci]